MALVTVKSEITKPKYKRPIKTPTDVSAKLKKRLTNLDREHFIGVYLNTKNQIIHIETIAIGSLNTITLHVREVFKPAILHSANAFIVVHNHPSGDPAPSKEDKAFTERLKTAGELLGIPLLDSIIIATDFVYSMSMNDNAEEWICEDFQSKAKKGE